MIPKTSRSQFVWAVIVVVAAIVYGNGKGGDQLAVVLMGIFAVALAWIGIALLPVRARQAEVLRETVSSWSLWPILGALSVLFLIFGFSVNGWYTVLGGVIAVVSAAGALGQSWREDLGWNPHFDERLQERIVRPLLIPIMSIVGIGIVAISISRVLLADSENTAVVIAIVLAAALLTVFSVLAAMKRLNPSFLIGLSVFAALAVIGVGIAAAGAGATKEEKVGKPFPPSFEIYAKDVSFVQNSSKGPAKKLTSLDDVPALRSVSFEFYNEDQPTVYHDVAIYESMAGGSQKPIWNGTPIPGGKSVKNTFVAPKAGTYLLRCDFHPNMVAQLNVVNSYQGTGE